MKPVLPWLVIFLFMGWMTMEVRSQTNLLSNPDFSARDPLEGWRVNFPHEGWYAENGKYVKGVPDPVKKGGACVEIGLPPGIAGNQGGKIESAFIPAEPGATYRVEVDCMTWDFSAKLHVETYAVDPSPNPKPDKFRVPADDGRPALVVCYRAQLPDPPAHSKKWDTISREFTVPDKAEVLGEEEPPAYLVVKAVVYEGATYGGKSYFTNFRLYRIKK